MKKACIHLVFIPLSLAITDLHAQTTCDGKNLIMNGDFEGAVTYWPSDFAQGFGPGSSRITKPVTMGAYAAATVNGRPGDHTKGDTTGNYLFVDVDDSGNARTWYCSVPVQANKTYEFSAWIANVNNKNRNPAQLKVFIEELDAKVSIFSPTGVETSDTDSALHEWSQIKTTWHSGSVSRVVEIKIVNLLLNATGNDLALDDISFSECDPLTTSFTQDESYDQCLIYPNPSSGSLHFRSAALSNAHFILYSALGELVAEETVDGQRESVLDLAEGAKAGIYTLKIVVNGKSSYQTLVISK